MANRQTGSAPHTRWNSANGCQSLDPSSAITIFEIAVSLGSISPEDLFPARDRLIVSAKNDRHTASGHPFPSETMHQKCQNANSASPEIRAKSDGRAND